MAHESAVRMRDVACYERGYEKNAALTPTEELFNDPEILYDLHFLRRARPFRDHYTNIFNVH